MSSENAGSSPVFEVSAQPKTPLPHPLLVVMPAASEVG
jgi:hypothetical protein